VRLKMVSIFLLLMFAVLAFGSLITITYNFEISKLQKISNSFYEKDTLFFRATNSPLQHSKLYEKLPMDTVFYATLPSYSNVRGVIYKGEFDFPNMKSGRFFNENEFKYDSKLAVVGANIPVDERDGKYYMEFYNKTYEVIGILGHSIPTRMDNMLMLTLNNDLLKLDSKYAISGSNLQVNYDFLGNEGLFGDVLVFGKQHFSILHVIDSSNSQAITSVLFMFVVMFNTSLIIYFWLDNKNNEIVINKANGCSDEYIYKFLYKEYMCIISSGLIIGTLIAMIFIMKRYTFIFTPIIINSITIFIISSIYFVVIVKIRLAKINNRKLGVID